MSLQRIGRFGPDLSSVSVDRRPSIHAQMRQTRHDHRMRIVLIIVGVLVAAVVIAMVLVRRLDHDADVWHVDPLTAPKPATPNSYRIAPAGASVDADQTSPTFSMSVRELAASFERVALDAGNVDVVGGSADSGWVTYVQTTALFAFPDYISVVFIEVDEAASTLAVFSRSRLGHSDLGVNQKRVRAWLAQLD
jgi:uncharacterized protein (DUF1499 family)